MMKRVCLVGPAYPYRGGIAHFTSTLAKEFGPKGITANIVSPGPIRPESDASEQAQHIKSMLGRVPIGRLGEPAEVAAAVSLLASDKGAFINGQMIQVNGGTET